MVTFEAPNMFTAKVSFLPEVNFHLDHVQPRCPLQGKTWAAAGKGGPRIILVTRHTGHCILTTQPPSARLRPSWQGQFK